MNSQCVIINLRKRYFQHSHESLKNAVYEFFKKPRNQVVQTAALFTIAKK